MDLEETMVEDTVETEDDFSEVEEVVEESNESEEDLDEFVQEDKPEEKPEPKAKVEPGYVQKRIDKALARERESMRASIKAEIEAAYAPMRERLLEMDAQELVRSGQVKDLELAKELVRLRQGMPAKEPQPRNEQGQFAPRNSTYERTQGRIDELKAQAAKIKSKTGIDVISEWNSNEEIKKAVIDGKMDFYDVAEQMQKRRKRPPSPMRSPNGAGGVSPNAIEAMTDAQFKKLDKELEEGRRFTVKR